MDPQKFGDSYDFVKSVPRQLFLPARCLKSNVTKLQSYKVSWRIQPRNWRAGRRRRKDSLQRIGEPDLCVRHAAIRLIDTLVGSHKDHYVNAMVLRTSPRSGSTQPAASLPTRGRFAWRPKAG